MDLTKNQRADLAATKFTVPVAMLIAIVVAILRLVDLFAIDGITTTVPLADGTATATLADGSVIAGGASSITVTSNEINTVSVICLAASIIALSLTWIAAALAMGVVANEISAGRAFSRTAVRWFSATSWIILGGTVLVMAFDTLGRNGVYATLSPDFDSPTGFPTMIPYIAPFAFAFALGLLAIAFHRGAQLQEETEGLV